MSQIRPLAAIRYSTKAGRDLSTRLAPPYDVLDAADKQAMLARDSHNFVAIDLPVVPAKQAGPPEVYEAARSTLASWLAEGTMLRDDKPGLYVYHQHFSHAGTKFARKMFFARLRLEPFGEGSVFPHERTFGGPKEDRLALTKSTRTNLSPIFGLYPDSANVVAQCLEAAIGPEPLATGTLDGVESRLWAVTNAKTIDEVTALMAPKPTFIADGHHRYGTSLMYRDGRVAQHGRLHADHPVNFVLCVFCAMEDPGLLILPTHRVLPNTAVTGDFLRSDPKLDVRPLASHAGGPDAADAVLRELPALGPQALAVYSASDKAFVAVRPRDAEILRELEPSHSDAWRKLGLAFLHAYLLERLIAPKLTGGAAPEIHYVKSASEAVNEARQTGGATMLMQPTTMEEMRAVCQANDLMPQKSTFFYPKLASGLVINSLE